MDVTLIAIEATGKWHRQVHRSLHASGFRRRRSSIRFARGFLPKRLGCWLRPTGWMRACWRCWPQSLTPQAKAPASEALEGAAGARAGARQRCCRENGTGEPARQPPTPRSCDVSSRPVSCESPRTLRAFKAEIEQRRSDTTRVLARRQAILHFDSRVSGPVTAATLLAQHGRTGILHRQADRHARRPGSAGRSVRSARRQARDPRRPRRRTPGPVSRRGQCQTMQSSYGGLLWPPHRRGKADTRWLSSAIARKLIVLANALVSQSRRWQSEPPFLLDNQHRCFPRESGGDAAAHRRAGELSRR